MAEIKIGLFEELKFISLTGINIEPVIAYFLTKDVRIFMGYIDDISDVDDNDADNDAEKVESDNQKLIHGQDEENNDEDEDDDDDDYSPYDEEIQEMQYMQIPIATNPTFFRDMVRFYGNMSFAFSDANNEKWKFTSEKGNNTFSFNDINEVIDVFTEILHALGFECEFIWEMIKKYEGFQFQIGQLQYLSEKYAKDTFDTFRQEIPKQIWYNQLMDFPYRDRIMDLYEPSVYVNQELKNFELAYELKSIPLFTNWIDLNEKSTHFILFNENYEPLDYLGKSLMSASFFPHKSFEFVKIMRNLDPQIQQDVFHFQISDTNYLGIKNIVGMTWKNEMNQLDPEQKSIAYSNLIYKAFDIVNPIVNQSVFCDGWHYLGGDDSPAFSEKMTLRLLQVLELKHAQNVLFVNVKSESASINVNEILKNYFNANNYLVEMHAYKPNNPFG